MNTKAKNYKVAPGFEDLFSFDNEEDRIEHRAQMISYRILSEVQKICEEKDIKMKDLAKMVDTSPSYITQLFRGNKQVNTAIMARFEESMNMLFNFSMQPEKEEHSDMTDLGMTVDALKKLRSLKTGYVIYGAKLGGAAIKTEQLLMEMQNEQKEKEAA